ncbi:MAG TPA: dihydrolipoyl dehydrogenase [Firmicutes bacterium]|nr:dihydrolipoyl dehydrogenase [Bacillota bacterium]
MRVVVIGGGPAGYVGAIRASQLGAEVVLVERRALGGTCLNEGCVPTKALLHTVGLFSQMRRAADLGIDVGEVKLDWARAQARKEAIVKRLVAGVGMLLRKAGVQVVRGNGRLAASQLVTPLRVTVKTEDGSETELKAEKVLLALGSRAIVPPIPGLDNPGVMYSAEALEVSELPRRLVVIGGGVIGIELATMFAKAGCDVVVVEMLHDILPPVDTELSRSLRQLLTRSGVRVYTGSRVVSVERRGDELVVRIRTEDKEEELTTDRLLVAVGRRPDAEGQGLEEAGVRVDRGKIVVDDYLETSRPGVFAAGDVIGGVMLAHVAFHEGIVAAENAVLGKNRRVDYKTVPNAIYTDPEVAGVGLTEKQARTMGLSIRIGRFPLAANAKALIENNGNGFVKVITSELDGKVIGLHILGPRATDMISEGGLALQMGASVEDIYATVHPHPTISEALAEACLAVDSRAIHIPNPPKPVRD